jgi:DNA sulfur modification protein DndE
MIETVKVSEKARIQLITLKKRTGIQNWNVLCRWAFCLSLKEPTPLPNETIVTDSSVEMTWRTFTGGEENLYFNLLMYRAKKDQVKIERDELNNYFKLHLHRGISYLNNIPSNSIQTFLGVALLK